MQSTGGILTHADLESYKVIVQPALEGTFKGKKVYTTRAPTSGPVLLHMLNLLEQYDLKGEGRSGLNTHRVVEAMKCKLVYVVVVCTMLIIYLHSRFRCKVCFNESSPCPELDLKTPGRTKICDPKFLNDTSQIEEISTKHFGNLIRGNITDVCVLHFFNHSSPLKFIYQDTTHTPDYYNPIYDVPEDHGTVSN